MSSSEAGIVVQALSAASLEKQLQSRPFATSASRNALVPAARAPWRRATENNIAGCLSRKRRDTAIVAIAFNGRKAAIVSDVSPRHRSISLGGGPVGARGRPCLGIIDDMALLMAAVDAGGQPHLASRRIYEYVRVLSLTRSPPATNRGSGPQRFLSILSFGPKKALR